MMNQILRNNNLQLDRGYLSRAGWYELSYPGTWVMDEGEECVTLCESLNDIGVLQASVYLAPSPQSPHDTLFEHLIDNGVTVNQSDLQHLKDEYKEIVSYDYIDKKRYYRAWIVTSGNYVMFITYICDESEKNTERDIVEAIVASVRFRKTIND